MKPTINCYQWCRSLLSVGGDNLQFYPNFALFSTLGGWTSTMILFRCGYLVKTKRKMQIEHFFSPISGEDQKKRSSSRIEHFFPKFTLSCTPIQIIGGDATIGGIQPNYWGVYPPILPGFRHPWLLILFFILKYNNASWIFYFCQVLYWVTKINATLAKPSHLSFSCLWFRTLDFTA